MPTMPTFSSSAKVCEEAGMLLEGDRSKEGMGERSVQALSRLIEEALREDIGPGDITTNAIVPHHLRGRAEIVAKERFVLSGLTVAMEVFRRLDEAVEVKAYHQDGDEVETGAVLCSLLGSVRGLLGAERVALNLLQHLSGIATMTRRFVREIERALGEGGRQVILVDTRKTTPLWRSLEREAVRHGGGRNHRFGLFDGVLIKDNHLVAAGGSIREAVRRVREAVHHLVKVEVEVESLGQLHEAIEAGADVILLDNFPPHEVKEAVAVCTAREVPCEVSGGITLANVGDFAHAGADFISAGSLTHSAPAVDVSMKLREVFT